MREALPIPCFPLLDDTVQILTGDPATTRRQPHNRNLVAANESVESFDGDVELGCDIAQLQQPTCDWTQGI